MESLLTGSISIDGGDDGGRRKESHVARSIGRSVGGETKSETMPPTESKDEDPIAPGPDFDYKPFKVGE